MPHHNHPTFEHVLAVLTRHDPEGLISAGAPADEYEPEAQNLTARLRAGQPITEEVLTQVWADWFSDQAWLLTDGAATTRTAIVEGLATITV